MFFSSLLANVIQSSIFQICVFLLKLVFGLFSQGSVYWNGESLANSLKNVEPILLGQVCWEDKVTSVCLVGCSAERGQVLERDKRPLLFLVYGPSSLGSITPS